MTLTQIVVLTFIIYLLTIAATRKVSNLMINKIIKRIEKMGYDYSSTFLFDFEKDYNICLIHEDSKSKAKVEAKYSIKKYNEFYSTLPVYNFIYAYKMLTRDNKLINDFILELKGKEILDNNLHVANNTEVKDTTLLKEIKDDSIQKIHDDIEYLKEEKEFLKYKIENRKEIKEEKEKNNYCKRIKFPDRKK